MSSTQDKTIEAIAFKIVLIGDSGVGKTSIISSYLMNQFSHEIKSTTGGNYFSKLIEYPKYDRNVKLDIWDTAGQEKYRSINKIFYQKTNGAILVYDITRKSSLKALDEFYNDLTKVVDKNSLVLTVVGNKNDLYMQEEVSDAEGKQFAKLHNASFKLTSAMNKFGINDLFENIGLELLEKEKLIEGRKDHSPSPTPITLTSTTSTKDNINAKPEGCAC